MKYLLLLGGLVLTSCGGTWSTRDLEFVAALPSPAALEAKLPLTATNSQPLSRRDGLNAGEPSQVFAETKKAVTEFNGLLDFFLGVLDSVRVVPPTSRSGESRTWGPFTAKDNPGFEFQVRIELLGTKSQETYGWKLEARKLGTQNFFDVVRGTFHPSPETVRKGAGQIEVPVKDYRDQLKLTESLNQLDSISLEYFTGGEPYTSTLAFTVAPGNISGYSTSGYAVKRAQGGSGAIGFSIKTNDVNTSRLDVISTWRADGAGRSISTVAEGSFLGTTKIECWNAAFKVTFFKENWPGGNESGTQSDCVSVEGL
jgi:hypothetical protein